MKKVLFVSFSFLFVLYEIMLKDISLAHTILNLKAFSWLVVLDIEFRISDIESQPECMDGNIYDINYM
jgi:hypothetical protein